MNIEFTNRACEELAYWVEMDYETVIKIKELLNSIEATPFKGIGTPEPLRHNLKGLWSRRINGEHRLVYQVTGKKGMDQKCTIYQCRFHYS